MYLSWLVCCSTASIVGKYSFVEFTSTCGHSRRCIWHACRSVSFVNILCISFSTQHVSHANSQQCLVFQPPWGMGSFNNGRLQKHAFSYMGACLSHTK